MNCAREKGAVRSFTLAFVLRFGRLVPTVRVMVKSGEMPRQAVRRVCLHILRRQFGPRGPDCCFFQVWDPRIVMPAMCVTVH